MRINFDLIIEKASFFFFDTNDADLSFIFFFFYDSWIICMEICFRKVHFILVQMDVETKQ